MRFCRSCYATLADDETVCHACGTRWPECGSTGVTLQEAESPITIEPVLATKKATERSRSITIPDIKPPSLPSAGRIKQRTWTRAFKSKRILGVLLVLLLIGGAAYALFHSSAISNSKYRLIVIVRDDDVQPYFGAASLKRLTEILEKSNVPVTLGIIPNPKGDTPIDSDKDQLAYLRGILAKGTMFEAALHGLTHKNTTRLSQFTWLDQSEFAGLPLVRQKELMHEGVALLRSALPSVSINTFIPPWGTYDDNTLIAMRDQGLTVVSSDDYVERLYYGEPRPPPDLRPSPQSPAISTSQPFVLNEIVHLPSNMETYNWTSRAFTPLGQLQDYFELFYARPGSTFMLLLHHWVHTTETHFQGLQNLINFIKNHEGIGFMTVGQFGRLFTTGALRKTLTGWQLSSEANVKLTLNSGQDLSLRLAQASSPLRTSAKYSEVKRYT